MKIFEGILKGSSLKKINNQELNNDIWRKIIEKKIKKNKKNYNQIISSSILSTLVASEFVNKNVKILDFGAGGLDVYFELNNLINNYKILNKKKSLKNKINLDIVELPIILEVYKKIKFSKNFKINFLKKFKKKKYDIIYISNALHYVNNPKESIKLISSTGSKYIIINSTRIGKNKTFITFQIFYKYKIPTWFFNLKNLLLQFKNNYELVFISDYQDNYLGEKTTLPMKNFPKKYRLKHTKTLIFKKR